MPGLDGLISAAVSSAADAFFGAIWKGALALLFGAFELADSLLGFGDGAGLVGADGTLAAGSPVAGVWAVMRSLSLLVALGLFFWQLAVSVQRGGAGLWRAATGPLAYGLANALTVGVVAVLLGGAEGLTRMLLYQANQATSFQAVLTTTPLANVFTDNPGFAAADALTRQAILALVAVFGVLPAGLAFVLQMIFRQAVIWVLIATIPVAAAGLLAHTTAGWFWRTLRWMITAILLKPALALVLVIGVSMLAQPTASLGQLLVAVAVLLIAVFAPFTLYRLLAFVEPGTPSGEAVRGSFSQRRGWQQLRADESSSQEAGIESTHTARFDAAAARPAGIGAGPSAIPAPSGASAAGGGASGGTAAGSPAGAAGAVAGVLAVARMVKDAGGAAGNFANVQMDQAGIGHSGGPVGAGAVPGMARGGYPRAAGGQVGEPSAAGQYWLPFGAAQGADAGPGGPVGPDPGPRMDLTPPGRGGYAETPLPDPAPGHHRPEPGPAGAQGGQQ